ncbi:MAG: hypothetical protein U5L08_05490 [Xanthomonadales bacterium]|nr:hypothetical protein [Xanthomonadales bacterium]
MADLIFLEVLQGIRDDREYEKPRRSLATLDHYELFGTALAGECAENFRALRKKGVTIRKTADVIIATFCIERGLPLLEVKLADRPELPDAWQRLVRQPVPYANPRDMEGDLRVVLANVERSLALAQMIISLIHQR